MTLKQSLYDDLVHRVQSCSLCSRMGQRKPVLNGSNGSLDSSVVFIAEAPGRLGADKYGIPLFGDQTGRNFNFFLASANISRESVFITNAVLCNPRKANGTNTTPSNSEIRNCCRYLKETIEIIQPKCIVSLGKKALEAIKLIHPLDITLKRDVGSLLPWNSCHLYPLFHPGPRALIWRSKAQQTEDYRKLSQLIFDQKLPDSTLF